MTGIDKGELLRIEAATIVARAMVVDATKVPAAMLARYIATAAEALEPYLRGPGYTVSQRADLGAKVMPMYQPPKGRE